MSIEDAGNEQRICESLKAKWNGSSFFSRHFPDWQMMGLSVPCAFPGAALTGLGLFTAEPVVLSPLDMNELLISLLWCVRNYIFWNQAKPKNNSLAPPQLPSLSSCTWSSHQILVLPKFPTSAASNNNKTWKGLSCPLYSCNKMDADLAVLFPSAIWQHSLSFSPSPPCEEWAQLIVGIRISSGACAGQGNFFPLMPIAPHLWCLSCVSHSPSPESSEVTGQKQLLSLDCADQITPRGFSLVKVASKIFCMACWRIKLFRSYGQLEGKAVMKKCCYAEVSGQKKPLIKALNRQDPFGQFISFSFLLWFLARLSLLKWNLIFMGISHSL